MLLWVGKNRERKVGKDQTYRYIWRGECILGDMARTHLLPDSSIDARDKLGREFFAGFHQQEQHDALVIVVGPSLAHADGILNHVREMRVDDRVDLRAAEPYPTGVEDAVGAAEEDHVLGDRMEHDEVAVRPDALEAGKVAVEVALLAVLAPELHGHGGEGFCRDELAGDAVVDFDADVAGFDGLVHHFHGDAEAEALAAADVYGEDWVAGSEGASEVRAAGDVVELGGGGKADVVEPFEESVGEDHACACDNF